MECFQSNTREQVAHEFNCKGNTLSIPETIPTQTVNSITYDFVRTGFGESTGVFMTADGLNRLTWSHTEKARNRHVSRLDRKAVVEDPLATGTNFEASMSVYTVVDMPRVGFSAADADWAWKLLNSILVEGSPDYSLRFLRGEV